MGNFPFHRQHKVHLTKIGTAGGWVRPSPGYHFKNGEKYSQKIIENIKNKKHPATGIANSRFRKYDTLFLDILNTNNEIGKKLFSSMIENNPAPKVFKFLDEETSFLEDIKIFSTFRYAPFQKAI
jgi:lycopene beta-cyclase